jgi:hypothetical protein
LPLLDIGEFNSVITGIILGSVTVMGIDAGATGRTTEFSRLMKPAKGLERDSIESMGRK